MFSFNSLRPRRNRRHFADDADDIFKCIFLNKNVSILIKTSLKVIPKGPINSIPALVQILASPLSGDKPLSESVMLSILHICDTLYQWVTQALPGCIKQLVLSKFYAILWNVYYFRWFLDWFTLVPHCPGRFAIYVNSFWLHIQVWAIQGWCCNMVI